MKIDSPNAIGITTIDNLTVTGTTNTGDLTASTLNLTTIGSGTSVTNLGITSGGNIVTGSTMVLPTYIMAACTFAQVIPNSTQYTVTNWTNVTAINAEEWNPTTGVFTATKGGTYLVTGNITYGNFIDTANTEYSVGIGKNDVIAGQARNFVQIDQTEATYKQTNTGAVVFTVVPGDTIKILAVQISGAQRQLHTNGNTMTIQELPSTITR